MAAAIECAAGAVERMREAKSNVAEGYGAGSTTYRMLCEMLGEETAR